MKDGQIKSVLNKYYNFKTKSAVTLGDCVRISDLLSKGRKSTRVHQALTLLEQTISKNFTETHRPKYALTYALQSMEKLHGINVEGNSTLVVPTTLRQLTADEFMGQLSQGRLFKDPGIDAGHGEYTHRIQWYILITQKVIQNTSGVQFLMGLGEKAFRLEGDPAGCALWDCLFDRLPNGGNHHKPPFGPNDQDDDFRCPERIMRYLASEGKDVYKNLSYIVTQRADERQDKKLFRLSRAQASKINWMISKVIGRDAWIIFTENISKFNKDEKKREDRIGAAIYYLLRKIDKDRDWLKIDAQEFESNNLLQLTLKSVAAKLLELVNMGYTNPQLTGELRSVFREYYDL